MCIYEVKKTENKPGTDRLVDAFSGIRLLVFELAILCDWHFPYFKQKCNSRAAVEAEMKSWIEIYGDG